MPITVYHYPKCSTCRKALKWLDAQGLRYEATDLVMTPPSPARLRDLQARSGRPLSAFFNRTGESYRQGGFKTRLPQMTDDQALAALAGDGKLIKRPIVDTGTAVVVGFDEAAYAAALAR